MIISTSYPGGTYIVSTYVRLDYSRGPDLRGKVWGRQYTRVRDSYEEPIRLHNDFAILFFAKLAAADSQASVNAPYRTI